MSTPTVRRLGRVDYAEIWQAMRAYTAARHGGSADQIWLLEHPAVYTLGMAGKPEHLLRDSGIPLVRSDRGGQITFHGPGQVVLYLLLDLRRHGYGVRELVRRLEQAVIELLRVHGVGATRQAGAPGVYVDGAKVAALGLRVRGGCTYHGLSLNVDMDLTPFGAINPCGYAGMAVTQLRDLGIALTPDLAGEALLEHLLRQLTAD